MTKKNDITKDGNVKKETTIYKDGKLAFQDIEKYEDGDLVRAETKEYDDGRLVYEYNYDSMFGTEYEEWHTYGEDGRKDSEYTINTDQHHKTVTYTAYENDKKDVSVGFEYGTHASYDGKVGGVGFKTYEYLENGEGLWREYRLGLSHEYNRKGEDIVFNSDQNEKLKYVRCTKFERLGADRYRSIDSTEHGDSKESRAKIEKLMDRAEEAEQDLVCETDNVRVFISDNPLAVFAHTSPENGRTEYPAVVIYNEAVGNILVSMKDPENGKQAGIVLDKVLTKTDRYGHTEGLILPHVGGISSVSVDNRKWAETLAAAVEETERIIEPPRSLEEIADLSELKNNVMEMIIKEAKERGIPRGEQESPSFTDLCRE